jgi:RNA polymerase sigma factor (sigma-70 family)
MAVGQLAPVLHYLRKVSSAEDEPSDRQLLERFADQGDEEAFAAVVRRHGPMVLGVCRRVLHHSHDADDAFQATFLLLVRKAGRLRWPDALSPWLYGVARRMAAKMKAHAHRRRLREGPVNDMAAPAADDLLWHDLRPVLDDAIGRLPSKYREPFVLCYLEGMTNAQAARHLGCPPGTIATWLSRAREQLRQRLAKRGLGLPAVLAATVVPPALVTRTVQAARESQMAAAAILSAKITTLTKGVGKMMWMHKLRIGVVALIAFGAAGTGVGVATYSAPAGESQAADDSERVPAPEPKTRDVRDVPKIIRPPVHAGDIDDSAIKVRTANFIVAAPSIRLGQIVADAAEYQRKKQAVRWLGEEMPSWKKPMPIKATITSKGANGYTAFAFKEGKVKSASMYLEGPLDQVLATTLPHEITHTILAHHFGVPIARWADEGAAMLSEDAESQLQHVLRLRELLKAEATYPLKRLFAFDDYPKNAAALHAQGYSVTDFLVQRKDHRTFLAFVKQGMKENWDKALERHYRISSVEELEKAWLASVQGSVDRAKEEPRKDLFLHVGPQPVMALALRRGDGAILVRTPTSFYQPVTTNEGDKTVTSYQLVHAEQSRLIDFSQTEAFDTAGKAVDAMTLSDLLRKETAVLVSTDGKKVDPFYLALVKEGTVILVPPPFRGEPRPPQIIEPPVAPPTSRQAPLPPDRERR